MAVVNAKDAGIAVNGTYTASINLVTELVKAGLIEIDDTDVVGTIAQFSDELARVLTSQRLTLMGEVVTDYPEASNNNRGGGGYKPRSGGNSPSTTSTDPATDKQKSYLEDLLASRAHSLSVDVGSVTKAQAAQYIEQLKGMASIA